MLGCLVSALLTIVAPPPIDTVRMLSYERDDRRIPLLRLTNRPGLFFQSKLSCDVDGSPNAYHPLDDNLALDVIESAEGRRVGGGRRGPLEKLPSPDIVVYVNGAPYIQTSGEFAGFYVAETSYQNPALPATDCARYLDARQVPYIVLPANHVPEAKLGDLAIVYDPVSHIHACAIYGDVGPSSESGEASLATIQRLGMAATDGKSSPGQMRDDIFFLVFPNTAAKREAAEGWPPTAAKIESLAETEFAAWGGERQIAAVLRAAGHGGPLSDEASNEWIYDELACFRARRLVADYPFGLPARVLRNGTPSRGPRRLPCAPELVVAVHDVLDQCERAVIAVERGQAPADTLTGLAAHIANIAPVFFAFPESTADELESAVRETARAVGLQERILQVTRGR